MQDELRDLAATLSGERTAAAKTAAQQRASSEEQLAKKEVRLPPSNTSPALDDCHLQLTTLSAPPILFLTIVCKSAGT